jgi:uncharacterized protein (DUF1330 family)
MQMPKGYWATTYRSIKDPDKLAAYARLAPVALAPFGVKYIVRGAPVAASEAGIKQRVVISVPAATRRRVKCALFASSSRKNRNRRVAASRWHAGVQAGSQWRRALAVIDILDDISGYQLPGGVTAEVAIYTDHWHHVAVMRRILLRMSSWMNYVFLEH